jgi:hypothetical protein
MVITPGKNEAAAENSSGGRISKIKSQNSLVQLRVKLLQRSHDQIVLMLHALHGRLATRHAGVVRDSMSKSRLTNVA